MCLISTPVLATVRQWTRQWRVALELIEWLISEGESARAVCQAVASLRPAQLYEQTRTKTCIHNKRPFLNFPLNCHVLGLPRRPGIPHRTLYPVTQHSGAGKSRCQLTLTPEGCKWASLGRTFANRNKLLKRQLRAVILEQQIKWLWVTWKVSLIATNAQTELLPGCAVCVRSMEVYSICQLTVAHFKLPTDDDTIYAKCSAGVHHHHHHHHVNLSSAKTNQNFHVTASHDEIYWSYTRSRSAKLTWW